MVLRAKLLSILLVLFSNMASSQYIATNRAELDIRGDVRLIEERSFQINLEEEVWKQGIQMRDQNFSFEFSPDGVLQEKREVDRFNRILKSYHYQYENDELVSREEKGDVGQVLELIKVSSEKNKVTYEKTLRDYVFGRQEIQFDKGLAITGSVYGTSDNLKSKWQNIYNADGALIEKQVFNVQDKLQLRFQYQYNEQGDLIEEASFHPSGDLKSLRKWEYEYDDHGNWFIKYHLSTDGYSMMTRRMIAYGDPERLSSDSKLVGVWLIPNYDSWLRFAEANVFQSGKGMETSMEGSWTYDAENDVLSTVDSRSDRRIDYKILVYGEKIIMVSIDGSQRFILIPEEV